jgi:hypothetical protein
VLNGANPDPTMEQRPPQEYVLEIFADQTFVKDIVKGWREDSTIF